jgi:kynurenine formamidase
VSGAAAAGTARAWIRDAASASIFDLGRALSPEVPHAPAHVPFMQRLVKAPGDVVDAYGMSASNDVLTMGTHVGTHIDGLGHVAVNGCLYGGAEAATVHDRFGGFADGFGIEHVAPIVVPAVVADIARARGVAELPPDHLVTPEELDQALDQQGAEIPAGGALIVRTGWGRAWPAVAFSAEESPGPGLEAVLYAWDRGARLFGSDTLVFEHLPSDGLPVHRELIVGRGAHIVEAMDLEALTEHCAWEFLLIIAPLRLTGATGSPIRPVALVPGSNAA